MTTAVRSSMPTVTQGVLQMNYKSPNPKSQTLNPQKNGMAPAASLDRTRRSEKVQVLELRARPNEKAQVLEKA